MLEVVPVSAFKDNYIWTLRNATHAAVVDPGEARPVLDYLAREKLELAAILATHHHADHVGGIAELLQNYRVPVYGPKQRADPDAHQPVSEGDTVTHPRARRRASRCSTSRAIRARTLPIMGQARCSAATRCSPAAAAACSKAPPQQMYASLEKLRALPDETKVYCGHEYTLANIGFAKAVEPGNAALAAREDARPAPARGRQARRCRAARRGEGHQPFPALHASPRWSSRSTSTSARVSDPVRVFAAIREWKNKS